LKSAEAVAHGREKILLPALRDVI